MTPSARFAALMEIMDILLEEWQKPRPRPAEIVLKQYSRERRYIGSKDRHALQEGCFALLRRFGQLKAQAEAAGLPLTGRIAVLLYGQAENMPLAEIERLCSREAYAPSLLTEPERILLNRPMLANAAERALPYWLVKSLQQEYQTETEKLINALMQPAPLDIRVNRLRITPRQALAALAEEGMIAQPIAGLENGLTLERHSPVTTTKLYLNGGIEVQDRGSQMVVEAGLKAMDFGNKNASAPLIIDYCAGGGGKSLAIASALRNQCRIIAWDADSKRLAQLDPRRKRAGASCIALWDKPPSQLPLADMILLDVPCSGTGTIRRHPDLPWRLQAADSDRYRQMQQEILRQALPLIKPGGYLYYVTCSLLRNENFQHVNDILTCDENLRVVTCPQIWDKSLATEEDALSLGILPHRHHSDGFFGVLFQRKA